MSTRLAHKDQIVMMLVGGSTATEIAKELGVKAEAVRNQRRVLNNNGVELPSSDTEFAKLSRELRALGRRPMNFNGRQFEDVRFR